jgi:hypothetical protein
MIFFLDVRNGARPLATHGDALCGLGTALRNSNRAPASGWRFATAERRNDEYLPNTPPGRALPAQKKLIRACRLFLQTAPKYAQMHKITNDTRVVPSDRIYPFAKVISETESGGENEDEAWSIFERGDGRHRFRGGRCAGERPNRQGRRQ